MTGNRWVFAGALACLWPTCAFAEAPSDLAQAPPPTPPPANFAAWTLGYTHARASLVDGKFAEAEAEFRHLADTAPTPLDRRLALELTGLAGSWRERQVALVAKAELEESSVEARRLNRRTTDEMSVLYLNAVVYGLASGGVIAVHTEPNSAAGVVLPSLFLGGAGALGAYGLDRVGLGYGVPQSIVSGMYLGLGEGIVWSLWNQAKSNYYDEWKATTVADVIWGSATLGAVAGGAISASYGATPGRASYVTSAALWTSVFTGYLTGAVVTNDSRADDSALLAAGIGLNAGAIAGVLTAGAVSPSIARVRFLDLGGIGGMLVFGGLYVSAADKHSNPHTAFAVAALGTASGLGLAWYLTKDMPKDDFSPRKPAASSGSSALSLAPAPGGGKLSFYGTF